MSHPECPLKSVYALNVVNPAPKEIQLPNCMYKMRALISVQTDSCPVEPGAREADLEHGSKAHLLNRKLDNILYGASNLLLDVTRERSKASPPSHPLIKTCQGTQSKDADTEHAHRLQRIHWLISSLELLQVQIGSTASQPEVMPRVVDQQDVFVDRIDWMTKEFRKLIGNVDTPSSATNTVNQEIVIKVNPQRPPYFLLSCLQMFPERSVSLRSFVHSSLSSQVSPALLELFNQRKADCGLDISVIWALSVSREPEMLVSPVHQSAPIVGEENIMRFLMRKWGNYERSGVSETTEFDYWLDLLPTWLHDKKAVLKRVDTQLKQQQVLVGSSVSMADVALWSVSNSDLKKDELARAPWMKLCSNQARYNVDNL